MNYRNILSASALVAMLYGCGGGGGDSTPAPPPPPPAPSALSYASPQTYTINAAITALNPTVTGTPTSYSVAPALPAGLALNTTTGVISGTPTALQTATTHTVTAGNAGGITTTTLNVTVRDVPPDITYPRVTYSFATGATITTASPSVTGGTVVSWSIDRALPAGLAFSTTTGQISGTPAAIAAPSAYVITATNSGGVDTFGLSIGVQNGALLELGHVASIRAVSYAGSHVLSVDDEGRVRLFNAQTGANVLAIETNCDASCGDLASLAGTTLVIRRIGGYDVYSVQMGVLLSHIASPAAAGTRWRLASDGSYLVAWNSAGLQAWSTNGTALVTRAGSYANAGVYAAPTEIRVGNGAAGAQVIEYIAMPGGTSTQSAAFIGAFHGWFGDGERFISRAAGTTIVVYSRSVAQQDTATLPTVTNLAGEGNWFWTFASNALTIYSVGASSTPAATFPVDTLDTISAAAGTIGILKYGDAMVGVVDLSGATPTKTDYQTRTTYNRSYAAKSATDFVVANWKGAMFGALASPQPLRYTYGAVRGIAGSTTRAALTTESGDTLFFDMATRALEGRIDFSGSKVELSTNGTVLGVSANDTSAQYATDRTLRIHALPSATVLAEWPAAYGGSTQPLDFYLSAAGDVVGRVLAQSTGSSSTFTRQVIRYDNSVIWTDTVPDAELELRFRLSPSGLLVGAPGDFTPRPNSATNIYTNGVLTGAPAGLAVGWLDDGRLLVNGYAANPNPNAPGALFTGAKIVGPAGQALGNSALPEMRAFQRIDANTIYSPTSNSILDVATGNTLWSTTTPARGQIGAVAGDQVVFVSGTTVRTEPR